jgi:pimeloyl-ACP methyl ester carboxylesterase
MELSYHVIGHGPPLVILHGLFGASDNWFTLAKYLGENFKVYAVDQRNHGRSPHSDEFDYRTMAGDLNGLLGHEGLRSAFLLGHSMGGKTAMEFSLSNPEMVDKLIVVDIAPRAYPPMHDQIFQAMFALKLDKFKMRSELDRALSQYIGDYAVRQLLLKNVVRDDAGDFKWRIDVAAIRKNYDKINEAIDGERHFRKPTLFIRGSRSTYIREDDISQIKSIFPCAEVVLIENAGHWVHAESPREFVAVVVEFLIRK